MPLQSMNAKTISAIWFVLLSALLAAPLCVARFLSIMDWSLASALHAVFLEGVIPMAVAAFFASSMGAEICQKGADISSRRAFLVGVKIALTSAASWVAITLVFTFILGRVVDASRIVAGIVILALFSLPITTSLAGIGAVILRILVVKQVILTQDSNDSHASRTS